MAILGSIGPKIGENGKFHPSRNAVTWDWHPMNQTA